MPKIPMTAIKDQVYAGRRIKAGAEFEVSGQSDARLLKALGRAKDRAPVAPTPVPVVSTPRSTYSTRMLAAAAPDTPHVPATLPEDSTRTASWATPSSVAAKKTAAKRVSGAVAASTSRRTDDDSSEG